MGFLVVFGLGFLCLYVVFLCGFFVGWVFFVCCVFLLVVVRFFGGGFVVFNLEEGLFRHE